MGVAGLLLVQNTQRDNVISISNSLGGPPLPIRTLQRGQSVPTPAGTLHEGQQENCCNAASVFGQALSKHWDTLLY